MIRRVVSSRRAMLIICVILFLTFLDNTIVSVALSNIQSKLSAGVQDLQWIVDAYMLVFAVFMLLGGTLGDILGRKKVMLAGVGIFVIGSIVAMLSSSVDVLISGRVIMGFGAAASEPGTLSMIRHLYPERKSRSKALGVWAAVSGIALAFGPIIGGIIIGFSDYRGVFAFSAIFGAIAFIAGAVFLIESYDRLDRSVDIFGLITGGVAIFSVITSLIIGENTGYDHPVNIALFGLSLVMLVLFILIERTTKDPILPLKFFKKIHFSLANMVAFSTNFGVFAVFFFVALYLQLIANFTGYDIALSFISMAVAIVAGAIVAGRWNAVHQTLPLSIFGCLVASLGIFVLNGLIKPDISASTLAWALVISGFGFGICLVSMTTTVLSIVPPERSGMAASTVNTFRELGGVFAVAILGEVVNAQLTTRLSHRLQLLHLPTNFQAFVIYAITHGGHTPSNAHITIAELASHAALIDKVTGDAYAAFGHGLGIALNIAGLLLLLSGLVSLAVYIKETFKLKKGSLSLAESTQQN